PTSPPPASSAPSTQGRAESPSSSTSRRGGVPPSGRSGIPSAAGPLHGGRATPSRSELPRTSTSQSWASGGSSAPKRGASETASTASTSSAVSASGEPRSEEHTSEL